MNDEAQITHSEPVEEPKTESTTDVKLVKEIATLKKKVAKLEKVLGL